MPTYCILKKYIPVLLIMLVNINLFGQDDNLKKEVYVVRPYEPSISDAFKINLFPKVEDSLKVIPNMTYSITQRPITLNFSVNPISAARMLAEPPKNLHGTYVKIGFGNYSSPFAEVFYNLKRSKEYSFGTWFQHHSSFGKIKLDNNKKTDAGYNKTNLNVFGKRIFEKSVLSAEAKLNSYNMRYYGYNISLPDGTTPDTKEQKYSSFSSKIEYFSTHTDSTHINYLFSAEFNHLADDFDMTENYLNVTLKMDKFRRTEHFGGDFSFNHFMNNASLDSANNTIIQFSPWINLFGKQWRVLAGVSFIVDAYSSNNQTFFFPRGLLSYDVISHYFIPYVEIGGYLEQNSYSKISQENPWVIPGINVWNTSHKMILTGGIKGNFSSRVSYNVNASYSLIDSMYFYINTSVDGANSYNRFDVISDNIKHTKVFGELAFALDSKLALLLRADFNSYSLQNVAKPWHLPDYNASALAKYNIKDKLIIDVEFYASGKRYVLTSDVAQTYKKIDGLMDFNLGVEYRYNRKLSAFVRLNNLTSSKYELWYLYPMQQFNMMFGVSYSF